MQYIKILFLLKITYGINSFIFALKRIPLIGKFFQSIDIQNNKTFKKIAFIISVIKEILKVFLTKFIYIAIIIISPIIFNVNEQIISANLFLTLFFYLTIIGGAINSSVFIGTPDKYYVIALMRMDSKKYSLLSIFSYNIKTFIGFIPALLLAGFILKINFLKCIGLAVFVILVKIVFQAMNIFIDTKVRKKLFERLRIAFNIIVIVPMLLMIVFAFIFDMYISWFVFNIVFIAFGILSILAFIYIIKFNNYKVLWKNVFSSLNIIINDESINSIVKKELEKKLDVEKTSTKHGYEFFNDLFIKRNFKVLIRPAIIKTIICAVLPLSAIILGVLDATKIAVIPLEIKSTLNSLIINSLPYFTFIMYILGVGKSFTKSLFLNCDYAMLNFRFYRNSTVVLRLFLSRLNSLIKLNIMPAFMIAFRFTDVFIYYRGNRKCL